MDAELFHERAGRVLSGEATPEERADFERDLAADPALQDEFAQLTLVRDVLLTSGPLVEAGRATEPALPLHRVHELRTAVRQHFGPAASRRKSSPLLNGLRWLLAGGGLTGLAALVVLFCCANRTIEIGLYSTDLEHVRGEQGLSAQDVPTAKLIPFDQDAPFDAWQDQPLAWYQHAKIWVDNEHDQLHIVRRVGHGSVVREDQPLASTDEARREQIRQAVQALSK